MIEQVTRNTVGTVTDAELRSELGTWITFASTGDVMGPGTQTAGREVYLYNVLTGTTTRVTNSGPGRESYEPSRVSDSTFSAGRPDSFFFTSTGNFTGQNADGNPEIFVYEIVAGVFHQLTNTVAPVVNKTPFTSDSAKCIVFASTGNLATTTVATTRASAPAARTRMAAKRFSSTPSPTTRTSPAATSRR